MGGERKVLKSICCLAELTFQMCSLQNRLEENTNMKVFMRREEQIVKILCTSLWRVNKTPGGMDVVLNETRRFKAIAPLPASSKLTLVS